MFNRRALCLLLALVVLLVPVVSLAEYDDEVTCEYVLVADMNSDTVLYEKQAGEKAYPASTTKIMTCILVLENCDNIREKVTIGKVVNEYGEGNSLMGLVAGDEVRVKELLYGLMLPSGNDAAAVLAEYIAGSTEAFADMMNEKAAELGMENTHYVTPHGLHDDEHYTTAEDMLKLVKYAMKNGDFAAIVSTPSYVCPATNKMEERTLYNSNRFISTRAKNKSYNWSAVTGVKTGFTNPAGGCLITTATADGKSLVSVVLGDFSDGQEARWSDTRSLLEYGFENLVSLELDELALTEQTVNVENADVNDEFAGDLALVLGTAGQSVACTKDMADSVIADASSVKITVKLDDKVTAPVRSGDKLGTAELSYDGKVFATVDATASRSVKEMAVEPEDTQSDETPEGSSLVGEKNVVNDSGSSIYLIIALVLIVFALLLVALRIVNQMRYKKRVKARKEALKGKKY